MIEVRGKKTFYAVVIVCSFDNMIMINVRGSECHYYNRVHAVLLEDIIIISIFDHLNIPLLRPAPLNPPIVPLSHSHSNQIWPDMLMFLENIKYLHLARGAATLYNMLIHPHISQSNQRLFRKLTLNPLN